MKTTLTILGLIGSTLLAQEPQYDSWHMGLAARMPYPYGSDVWGYTDENGHDFAVFGVLDGTVIVDVSTNPSIPVETGYIPGTFSGWRDLKTHRDYLYVTNEGGGGLDIIDLTDPWNPTLAKRYTGFNTAHNLYIADGFAYIVGSDLGGIQILDLENPVSPKKAGSWETTYIHDIYVKNDTAYACAIYDGDLHILDVSNKSDIQTLSVLDSADYGTHAVWTTEDSKFIITADEFNGGHVKIWDAADLDSIYLASEYEVEPEKEKSVHNVFVKGDKLFVSYYVFGTRVVDISDPYNPEEVAYFDLYPGESGTYAGNWGTYPFTASGLIYSTSMSGDGFFILQYPLYAEFTHEPLTDREDSVGPYPVSVIVEAGDENELVKSTIIGVSGLDADFTDTTYLVAGEDPGEFVGDLPGYGSAGALTYYFAVQDTAGRWSTGPYGAPDSYYSFNVGPDAISPVIHSVSEIGNQFGQSGTVPVEAVISDNIAVAEAQLEYTIRSGDVDTPYSTLMVYQDSVWKGDLSWDQVSWHSVITYWVRAIDSTSQRNETVSEPIAFEIQNWTVLGNWEAKDLVPWDTGDGWGIDGFSDRGRVVNDSPGKTYENNANNALTRTDPINVEAYSSAYMEFWHLSLLETDKDSGYVEISTDGVAWTAVSTITGLGIQREEQIDLSSYLESGELWVRFRMTSDEENVYGGWFIDDVIFMVDTSLQTISVESPFDGVPERFSLEGNFPNPFNATTTIVYLLPVSGEVRLAVYDLMGREVAVLREGIKGPGRHRVVWNAGLVSSGVYVSRLTVEKNGRTLFNASGKMVVLK